MCSRRDALGAISPLPLVAGKRRKKPCLEKVSVTWSKSKAQWIWHPSYPINYTGGCLRADLFCRMSGYFVQQIFHILAWSVYVVVIIIRSDRLVQNTAMSFSPLCISHVSIRGYKPSTAGSRGVHSRPPLSDFLNFGEGVSYMCWGV